MVKRYTTCLREAEANLNITLPQRDCSIVSATFAERALYVKQRAEIEHMAFDLWYWSLRNDSPKMSTAAFTVVYNAAIEGTILPNNFDIVATKVANLINLYNRIKLADSQ